MKQELWLSRDGGKGGYNISEVEPKLGLASKLFHPWTYYVCDDKFHLLVQGARLRKGRKRKIKRILIELED